MKEGEKWGLPSAGSDVIVTMKPYVFFVSITLDSFGSDFKILNGRLKLEFDLDDDKSKAYLISS